MGADLLCYICKGPRKLSKQRRQRAVRAITPLLKALGEDREPAALKGVDELDDELVEKVLRAFGADRNAVIPDDSDDRTHLVTELLAVQALHDIDFASPADVVEKFADFWQDGGARDSCRRDDPDDGKQQIIVAGEMSWGDEPEGYGYQMLKMASLYGLLEAFDIR